VSSDKLFILKHRYCFILNAVKRKKVDWIGHNLRRNCLIKHVIEGKIEGRIEMTGRRRRRRKQLLNDFQEKQVTVS
jgi:hypothetical protein